MSPREFGIRHDQGLLWIAADRNRRGIELQPPPWLRAFDNDELMPEGVRRWNRLGRRAAAGDDRAFEFVVGGHHRTLEKSEIGSQHMQRPVTKTTATPPRCLIEMSGGRIRSLD